MFKKNDNWWIDYYVQGKRRREKIGPSKKLAEIVLCKRKVEVAEGKHLDKKQYSNTTFTAWNETYLTHAFVVKRSFATDRSVTKQLPPEWDNLALAEITTGHIQRWVDSLQGTLKPASINRYLMVVKRMFSMAVEHGILERNPTTPVKPLPVNNERVRVLYEHELLTLKLYASPTLRRIILVAVNTGMRLSEIVNLQWDDIDLDKKMLTLRHSKNDTVRHVPLTEKVAQELHVWGQRSGEYVFPKADYGKQFKRLAVKEGINDCSFHDLRHTFASRLAMGGVDLYSIQRLLGHKSMAMTQRYAHLDPNYQRDAIKCLEGHQK